MFVKKAQALLGAAIYDEKISVVEASFKQKKWMVQSVWSGPCSAQSGKASEIQDWHTLKMILHQFVDDYHLKGRTVAISVPDHLINWQTITVPFLKKKKTELMIKEHLAYEFPNQDQTFYVDFQVMNQSNQNIKKLILSIIHKNYIDELITCLSDSCLVPKVIDLHGHAIWRVLSHGLTHPPDAVFYQNKRNIIFLNIKEQVVHTNEYQVDDYLDHQFFLALLDSIKNQASEKKRLLIYCENETKEILNKIKSHEKTNIELIDIHHNLFHDSNSQSAFQNLGLTFLIALGCAMRRGRTC